MFRRKMNSGVDCKTKIFEKILKNQIEKQKNKEDKNKIERKLTKRSFRRAWKTTERKIITLK